MVAVICELTLQLLKKVNQIMITIRYSTLLGIRIIKGRFAHLISPTV